MNKFLVKNLYEKHHAKHRPLDFSVLKKDRGELFSKIIGTGKKILDLGCRDGALSEYFLKNNKVVGVDVDEIALERAAQKGMKVLKMDVYGDWGELGGGKFDVIVAGEVLEHLFLPEEVIEKTKGHLEKNGIFIGSVPNAFSLKNRVRLFLGKKKNTPLSDPTHVNHFSFKELKFIIKKYFNDVRIIGLGRYHFFAKHFPEWFAFDLVFVAKNEK
ncbi:MAG: class I SAM-dependent methyltransferase [Patescibacteria group bacterium]